MNLKELLSYIEFDYYWETNKEGIRVIKLTDNQYANLGDIEDEEFTSVAEVIDRCEIYWNDYCITPLCEDMNISTNYTWTSIYDYAKKYYGENEVDKYTILGYLVNPSLVVLDDEERT